ncbi:Uncharacterised protein [Mycobacteroides abscessus subsp. abscessus]|nr:Uncharacterised protein [Mycobacteroides abscessus subsp. abscessus]
MPSASPLTNPPGWSLIRCEGSRLANSSRHAGYGWVSTTVTVLPPPEELTSEISR